MSTTSRQVVTLVVGVGAMLIGAGCSHHPQTQPLADQKNLIEDVRVQQDDINSGAVSYPDLFYAGKHIFSNRFTTDDHYGEGSEGPRRSQYSWTDRPDYPFLRFNGLDSQSCLECHSVIGFSSQAHSKDEEQIRFIKQPGITGGGAGFASNAFGLTNFACDAGTEGCEPEKPTSGFVRSPPHAFGAGYTQQLAEEMTWDLQAIREEAATNTPGVSVPLESKGVSFGEVVVNADQSIDVVASKLEGVSADLIVRPFQWKGLTSNLRNFITGAMNFHFSIQPKELLDAGALKDDKDGEVNEIREGEISAVAAFLAMLRPPIESSKGLQEHRVEKGRAVFMKSDCAICHTPTLEMENPYVSVRDPRNDQTVQAAIQADVSYAFSEKAFKAPPSAPALTVPYGTVAPAVEKFGVKKRFKAEKKGLAKDEFNTMLSQEFSGTFSGFVHNLNDSSGPPESLPRLPQNEEGTVDVPLYSDLKRHVMGENLQETFDPQETDGGSEHTVPGNQFLTRPLWGVADTGPWMHDGRALTLTEAILMHEGEGSEANVSIGKFKGLTDDEVLSLRTFLSSLRLPKFKPCHLWCG